MSTSKRIAWALVIVVACGGVGFANWTDSFDGGKLGLTTWTFAACPQVTGTYKGTAQTAADGNGYLVLTETTPYDTGAGKYGAAFGAAFGTPEKFKDVRVGATVNVGGDADHNYYGLLARATYFIDPDGKMSGLAPGFFASCYIMHIDYSNGPANLALDLEKVLNNQNVMDKDVGVVIPRVENARSYYAEIEVVGAGPVYVTGRLYEFKGGPLVAQTPTMVDTDAKDAWEDAGKREKVYTEGVSGIFAQNEDAVPVGFNVTWDDVSSVSDGPTAVLLSPADGATGVAMNADLSWVEAAFATGRQLWFGPAGNMQLVSPNPAKGSFDPGMLQAGTTYEWRVDQVGATGTVQGRTWRFTTSKNIVVDDFESYTNNSPNRLFQTWIDGLGFSADQFFPNGDPGNGTNGLVGYDPEKGNIAETSIVHGGSQSMPIKYNNAGDPKIAEAERTFATPQDWTVGSPDVLSIAFRGVRDNVEQKLYVRVEDAAGNKATVEYFAFVVQTEYWRVWNIPLADFAGVDLKAVKKLVIGAGDGTGTNQKADDYDTLYIDDICLSFVD
jgi:hypothetical protein